MHGARDTHIAEKQRDETDETQKRVNIFQGRPELTLALLDRVELKARAPKRLLHGLRERVAIDLGQQFEMHAMPCEPTFLQQSRRLHARRRDEHAR